MRAEAGDNARSAAEQAYHEISPRARGRPYSTADVCADRLEEDYKAIQTFQNRWALLRKEYAAQLDCNNSVEDALRNLSLADMSHGADVVKSIVDSLRNELTEVSLVQKDVLNLDDRMNAAQKAIENIKEIRGAICR